MSSLPLPPRMKYVAGSQPWIYTHLTHRQAAKGYENHLKTQGKPANHAKAVEVL